MEIPLQSLNPEIVDEIIKEFVLMEGTDYGHEDIPLDKKIAQVKVQIESGRAKIVYDEDTETCSITTR